MHCVDGGLEHEVVVDAETQRHGGRVLVEVRDRMFFTASSGTAVASSLSNSR